MNWLKKGPELKKPNVEVPPFLGDLYYDLRERRLLPIVALAVVAIAAVPFLLGGSGEEEEPTVSGAGGNAIAGSSGAQARSFTVVESKPGLRDYRKRLDHRSPTNPFKQRFNAPSLETAQLNPEAETSSVTVTEEGEATPPSGGSGSGGGGGLVFFAWAIDLTIKKSAPGGSGAEQQAEGLGTVRGGATQNAPVELASEPETTVRHDVLPQTRLPGDKQPVATYMGPSKKGLPLFLVSSKVKSVFGESKCVSGDDSCQLLEVELKFPVTFVYGPNEVRYTFNVSKIEPIVVGHS